eukprot:g1398.t1
MREVKKLSKDDGDDDGRVVCEAMEAGSEERRRPSLYLVGAGPGDPSLMTLKAKDLVLRSDHTIICDQLIYESMKHCFGRKDIIKRPRWQDDLNVIIENELEKGRSVVRLKTGDPAIFGRTVLESGYFLERGYHVRIVPGVTSALASPMYAGVLATMNDISNRVIIMTGTLAKEASSSNIPQYDPQTTLIVLMAVKKIAKITDIMKTTLLYPGNCPVCVVQDASSTSKRVFSDVDNIARIVNDPENPIRTPATFIFGRVCGKDRRISGLSVWTDSVPCTPSSSLYLTSTPSLRPTGAFPTTTTKRPTFESKGAASSGDEEDSDDDAVGPQTTKALPNDLFLVGAGPGDPSLMTVRARDVLSRADTIICDRLVFDTMSEFLGKSRDASTLIPRPKKQSDVNAIIERELAQNRSVARLKTGDPAIYGRVALEAGYFIERGRRVHVVPGVSSALAAPLYAGVLTTMRGVANRVVVMTGSLAKGKDSTANVPNYDASTTLVLLMGVRKIETFARRLVESFDYPPDLSACVIQEASTARERVVFGTVGNIFNASRKAGVKSPAVFVFGEVCKYRDRVEGLKVY